MLLVDEDPITDFERREEKSWDFGVLVQGKGRVGRLLGRNDCLKDRETWRREKGECRVV